MVRPSGPLDLLLSSFKLATFFPHLPRPLPLAPRPLYTHPRLQPYRPSPLARSFASSAPSSARVLPDAPQLDHGNGPRPSAHPAGTCWGAQWARSYRMNNQRAGWGFGAFRRASSHDAKGNEEFSFPSATYESNPRSNPWHRLFARATFRRRSSSHRTRPSSSSSSSSSSSRSSFFSCGNRCRALAPRPRKRFHRLFLLFLDERRRRQPQREAHLRHVCRMVHGEVAGFYGDGPWSHSSWRERKLSRRMEERRRWSEGWKAGAGAAGGGQEEEFKWRRAWKHHRRHHHHHHAHHRSYHSPFDYSTFRRAYWHNKTFSSSRPYSRSYFARPHRSRDRRYKGWSLCRESFHRNKTGLAYFTYQASPDAKKFGCAGERGVLRGGDSRDQPARRIDLTRRNGGYSVAKEQQRLGAAGARPSPLASSSPLYRLVSRPFFPRSASPASSRAFSTSRPNSAPLYPPTLTPLELGLPFLLPLAAVLKSSAALHCLTFLTRISLTLLPLSLRSKCLHVLRTRYLRDPASLGSRIFGRFALDRHGDPLGRDSSFLTRWNALIGVPLLVLAPLFLLALVALASLERTPITGRWRIVMLSPAEEAELVDSILSAGAAPAAATTSQAALDGAPEGTSLDWVTILRQVLALPDEGVDPATGRRMLLGGVVLDERDWRVRWTEAVLRALEKGVVDGLAGTAGGAGGAEVLRPPPTAYPLESRPADDHSWTGELVLSKHLEQGKAPLKVEYDVLVIDRDESNAFSFGFGPDRAGGAVGEGGRGRRGVIVVYTGFLHEILGSSSSMPSVSASASAPSPPPSRLSSLFSRASPSANPAPTDPIAANLVPPVLPSQEQTKSLAVLLSHELAHLCLSHTLESYASTSLLVPHLSRLTSDVLRTLLYPLTALLGPFINDALGRSLNEGAQGGFGCIGHAVNSCESRRLESEADVVALRLLAGSGIDPRFALEFWSDRLVVHSSSSPAASGSSSPPPSTAMPHLSHPNPLRLHYSKEGGVEGFMRSHPVDEERVERIRRELESWERWRDGMRAREEALAAVVAAV
ncbi:hypothetical protein JCM1840_000949 [Sporobolomyces johnsonii]